MPSRQKALHRGSFLHGTQIHRQPGPAVPRFPIGSLGMSWDVHYLSPKKWHCQEIEYLKEKDRAVYLGPYIRIIYCQIVPDYPVLLVSLSFSSLAIKWGAMALGTSSKMPDEGLSATEPELWDIVELGRATGVPSWAHTWRCFWCKTWNMI